ncbi:DUF4181 domain-containing protein [Solibacillus sp. FSL K6-1523]|uniref:DUF4181 domain-containing protein n=1 Tax=Solibacillus sp. FSL K6-1523 TaxID=2921471 RepID=UPI0030FAD8DF
MIWGNFVFTVLIVFVLNTIVRLLLRKLFKIEKEKKSILSSLFSNKPINELHRKIEWAIRITWIIAFIVTYNLVIIQGYSINLILIASFFYILLDSTVRAFFECKYSQNPKQYILTISEGILFLLTLVIVIKFDLLIELT